MRCHPSSSSAQRSQKSHQHRAEALASRPLTDHTLFRGFFAANNGNPPSSSSSWAGWGASPVSCFLFSFASICFRFSFFRLKFSSSSASFASLADLNAGCVGSMAKSALLNMRSSRGSLTLISGASATSSTPSRCFLVPRIARRVKCCSSSSSSARPSSAASGGSSGPSSSDWSTGICLFLRTFLSAAMLCSSAWASRSFFCASIFSFKDILYSFFFCFFFSRNRCQGPRASCSRSSLPSPLALAAARLAISSSSGSKVAVISMLFFSPSLSSSSLREPNKLLRKVSARSSSRSSESEEAR
mmetsp:Transcript_32001/g.76751  ORF Transcript_32001/g.76751 Transcript_32001/m.76751 type:complete len:301 (+) Transcript_32001:583-1485(+)